LVAACSPMITPPASPSDGTRPSVVPSLPTTAPSAPPSPTAVVSTTATPCAREGDAAFTGVLEARPEGWFDQTASPALLDFPKTYGQVYGPEGVTIPPYEGPGRLAFYETFPASDAYIQSRIEQSRHRGGKPIAVTVCGEATEVWLDETTGELVVGWTDRDKSDVLVANTADFSVQALIDSAERVYDCCG